MNIVSGVEILRTGSSHLSNNIKEGIGETEIKRLKKGHGEHGTLSLHITVLTPPSSI